MTPHEGPYVMMRQNPATNRLWVEPGKDFATAGGDREMSAIEAARFLARWGFDTHTLDTYVVRAADGFHWPARNFLEAFPVETLIATWTIGTPRATAARQQFMHSYWPNLAKALDNLETSYDRDYAPDPNG